MAQPKLHPDFLEAEQKFRDKVTPLHQEESALRELIRRDIDASDEERMDRYIKEYQEINLKVEDLQHEFYATVENERGDLEKILHESGSPDHLIAASNLDKEKREEVMDLALSTGQPGLAKALAQTARMNNQFGVYEKWCRDDPIRSSALDKHRGLPDRERLEDRIFKGLKLPKSELSGLQPTAEHVRLAEEEARENAAAKQRAEFFQLPKYGSVGNPIKQVGRRGAPEDNRRLSPDGSAA